VTIPVQAEKIINSRVFNLFPLVCAIRGVKWWLQLKWWDTAPSTSRTVAVSRRPVTGQTGAGAAQTQVEQQVIPRRDCN